MCNIIKNIKSILKGKIYIIRNFADSQLCSRCPTTYCPPVESTCTCTPSVLTTNHSTVLSPHNFRKIFVIFSGQTKSTVSNNENE